MMNDPWISAESMLRWQIDLLRDRLAKSIDGWEKGGEVFPLPKAKNGALPHGLPSGWAFGKLTMQQVSSMHYAESIRWYLRELEKADAALAAGDLAIAIYLLVRATQGVNSANSQRYSSSAISMWRYVEGYRGKQADKAKRPRGKIGAEGETLSSIICDLALLPQYQDESGKELWPHLFAELDALGLKPVEVDHPSDPKKSKYEYDFQDGRKEITLGTFLKEVSLFRTGKKLP
jgi:hypothetical protein